ncbi:hypothetical protein OE88DRAFT_1666027 [Heliocybe sulcata]|uniref:RGS domain-containing protein n=1 Tax=Heliocybe sulcata TaxID=5364 RepID=A0A5C3MR68_9AGAM|nr:hypothetical protein OE88DRAFT_1666027 [Heliocybe sulcata]
MSGDNMQDDWATARKNRLPSFTEVLSRRTRPPVDLFMFYLFLQREGAEDILDFWLDVQQHENLCRAYFKDVRKSGRTIRDDWPQYWDYARRRGSIYGTVVGLNPSSAAGMQTKRSTASTGEMLTQQEKDNLAGLGSTSPRPMSPQDPFDAPRSTTPFSVGARTPMLFNKRASRAPTVIHRSQAVTRQDLIRSAEHIFYKYLSPANNTIDGESHEIYLPPSLRIHSFPLNSDREPRSDQEQALMAQIPDMFHVQKEYCFHAMEQDAFPRFLRAKAFGNLTPVSALVRLVAGLIILWIGLATGFSLIFLDVHPKAKRFFLFIPFTLAILFLISHQYELDPVLILFNQSESTPFRTLSIKEPYVKKLLVGRALWVSMLVAACTVALTLIFWAVPGKRL